MERFSQKELAECSICKEKKFDHPSGICHHCLRDLVENVQGANNSELRKQLDWVMHGVISTLEQHTREIKNLGEIGAYGARIEQSDSWSPSGLYKCERARWFDRNAREFRQVNDNITKRNMDIGTVLHGLIQSILSPHYEIEFDIEKTVRWQKHEIRLHGYIDILMKDLIVDIKTINQFGFKKLGMAPLHTKKHYINQLNAYAIMANRPVYGVIFINTSDLDYVVDVGTADLELFKEDMGAIVRILEDCPKKTPNFEWECKYCKYKQLCGNTYKKKPTKRFI